jgi:hypothetical protein
VSWKRAISVVVLAVLTGIPVAGMTCALICEPAGHRAARQPGHHDADAACAAAAGASADVRVIAASRHDCRSHTSLAGLPAILVDRAGAGASTMPIATAAPLLPAVRRHHESPSRLEGRAPPILSPPGAPPLILRI